MSDKLLTTRDAAGYIGMSPAFLERDRWAGAMIPFVRVGKRAVRYRLGDLDNFIAGRMRRNTTDISPRRSQ